MSRLWRTWALAAALALAALPAAHAGRSCETRPLTAQAMTQGLTMAEQTLNALDATGAKVVVLARAGQDLSRYGLRYSHLGFAYQVPDAQAPGGHVWRVLHKLNACGTATASVYRQGLGEFFLDDPWRYEAAWVVPTPEVQERLLALLADWRRATALHSPAYSVVAYPWAVRYQQSNQWVLETLAAVLEPGVAGNRTRAQQWLRFKGYEPTTLRIDALTRLSGRLTAANVAFDDHPSEKRFSDRIETVTVDSVFAFLQRTGMASAPQGWQLGTASR